MMNEGGRDWNGLVLRLIIMTMMMMVMRVRGLMRGRGGMMRGSGMR